MDKAISTKIKKILKTKATKTKISYKSPKQIAKQSQVVIINQEKPKRRYTKRGKAMMGGGGGDSKIVYIPISQPNFNIPAQNPQIISQPIPQMIRDFQPTQIYRNPLRMDPFQAALNPAPFNQNKPGPSNIEGNLADVPIASPPPLQQDIVLEPNNLFMPSTPVPAYPIMPSSTPGQGFTENLAVNQLNQTVQDEVAAYNDFGGKDAQAEEEARRMRLAKQLSGGEYYQRQREMSQNQPLSEQDIQAVQLYIYTKGKQEFLRGFTDEEREMYKTGRKLSQTRNTDPVIISIIKDAEKGGRK
jgi:hypothetical protein